VGAFSLRFDQHPRPYGLRPKSATQFGTMSGVCRREGTNERIQHLAVTHAAYSRLCAVRVLPRYTTEMVERRSVGSIPGGGGTVECRYADVIEKLWKREPHSSCFTAGWWFAKHHKSSANLSAHGSPRAAIIPALPRNMVVPVRAFMAFTWACIDTGPVRVCNPHYTI